MGVTGDLGVNNGSLAVNNTLTAGGNVTASQNVTMQGATVTGNLTATAGNVVGGAVSAANVAAGGSVGLGSVTAGNVTAGTTVMVSGATTDSGNITGNGVTLTGPVTLNGTTAQKIDAGTGTLTAGSTVTKTGAGDLTLAGATGVGVTGDVAVNNGNLTVNNALTAGGNVTTTGTQDYKGTVVVAGNDVMVSTGNENITFFSTVDADAAANSRTLAVNTGGTTTFKDKVGNSQTLQSLTTDAAGTTVLGNAATDASMSVKTRGGGQSYGDTVTLGANTTASDTGGGSITFNKTLDADAAANDRALAVNTGGTTTFNDKVGASQALQSLTTGVGGTTVLGNAATDANMAIKTQGGGQSYGNAVTLGANTTTSDTASGSVTFNSTVDADAVANNRNLTVNTSGTTTFGDKVGNVQALQGLTTDAAGTTVLGNSAIDPNMLVMTQSGTQGSGQNYGGKVILGANTTVSDTGIGGITFNQTVNADQAGNSRTLSLVMSAGDTTTFKDQVGGSQSLHKVNAVGSTTVLGDRGNRSEHVGRNAGGGQDYRGSVFELGADTKLIDTGGGPLLIGGTSVAKGVFTLVLNNVDASDQGEFNDSRILSSLSPKPKKDKAPASKVSKSERPTPPPGINLGRLGCAVKNPQIAIMESMTLGCVFRPGKKIACVMVGLLLAGMVGICVAQPAAKPAAVAASDEKQKNQESAEPILPGAEKIHGILVVPRWEDVNVVGVTGLNGLVGVKGPKFLRTPQFEALMEKYFDKPLTKAALTAMQTDIIKYCRAHGHLVVDVFFRDQEILEGTIQIAVIEGKVGKITVNHSGTKGFADSIVTNNVRLKAGDVVLADRLNGDLSWLNQNTYQSLGYDGFDGSFREVSASFQQGNLGETDVKLNVQERSPLRGFAGFDDSGIQTLGKDRVFFGFNWANVFGLDQRFNYEYITDTDFKRLREHTASYVIPLPWRHTLTFFGVYADVDPDFSVISPNLSSLRNKGDFYQTSARYTIPLPATKNFDEEISGGFDFKHTDTPLLFEAAGPGGLLNSNNVDVAQFILAYTGRLKDPWGGTAFLLQGAYSPGDLTEHNTRAAYTDFEANTSPKYLYGRGELRRETMLPYNFSLYNPRRRPVLRMPN